MPININYDVSPALTGAASFLAGRGEYIKYLEQLRRQQEEAARQQQQHQERMQLARDQQAFSYQQGLLNRAIDERLSQGREQRDYFRDLQEMQWRAQQSELQRKHQAQLQQQQYATEEQRIAQDHANRMAIEEQRRNSQWDVGAYEQFADNIDGIVQQRQSIGEQLTPQGQEFLSAYRNEVRELYRQRQKRFNPFTDEFERTLAELHQKRLDEMRTNSSLYFASPPKIEDVASQNIVPLARFIPGSPPNAYAVRSGENNWRIVHTDRDEDTESERRQREWVKLIDQAKKELEERILPMQGEVRSATQEEIQQKAAQLYREQEQVQQMASAMIPPPAARMPAPGAAPVPVTPPAGMPPPSYPQPAQPQAPGALESVQVPNHLMTKLQELVVLSERQGGLTVEQKAELAEIEAQLRALAAQAK